MAESATEPLFCPMTVDDAIAYADRVWRDGPDRYKMDAETIAALAVLSDIAREVRRQEHSDDE